MSVLHLYYYYYYHHHHRHFNSQANPIILRHLSSADPCFLLSVFFFPFCLKGRVLEWMQIAWRLFSRNCEFESKFYLLAMWCWADCLTALSFSFFIYKIITSPSLDFYKSEMRGEVSLWFLAHSRYSRNGISFYTWKKPTPQLTKNCLSHI